MCRICYSKASRIDPTPQKKAAKRLQNNKWQMDNKTYTKDRTYRSKYGLTLEQVEQKIREQESRCAICKVFTDKLHVDHHHDTKTVRGMLCGTCNRAIGGLKECPEIILSALKYLFYWAARYGKA